MNRYVQRTRFTLYYALKLSLVNIGERYIIAHYKRHTPVVVLDMERFSPAARHLVNKAENASVFAASDTAYKVVGEVYAERLVHVLFNVGFHYFAVGRFYRYHKVFGCT